MIGQNLGQSCQGLRGQIDISFLAENSEPLKLCISGACDQVILHLQHEEIDVEVRTIIKLNEIIDKHLP